MSGKGRRYRVVFGDALSVRSALEGLGARGEGRFGGGGVGDAPRLVPQRFVVRDRCILGISRVIRVSKGRLYRGVFAESVGDVLAEAREFFGELYRAGGGFAEPEWDAGGLAVGVFDADDAGFDAANAPRSGAEEDDVAGHALDREVFVEGADEGAFRFGQDAVVGDFGDRAAALDGGHARAAAAADNAVDAVAMEVSRCFAGSYRDALIEHFDDLVEVVPVEFGVRRRLAEESEQVVLAPRLAGGFGDDLLGEDVERRNGWEEAVEAAGLDAADEGGALDELVAGRREEAALWREAEGVAGAADGLGGGRHGTGGLGLADEVDRADVDAEFQGGGGDERLHLAGLEALLEVQAALLREATVVGTDMLLADAFGEGEGGALRQAAGVYEDEGRAVLLDELGEAGGHVAPLLAGGDGLEVRRRDLDLDFEGARVSRRRAWTSSTMTVFTVRRTSRLRSAVSMR